MLYNTLLLSAPLLIAGHGAMVYPPPRSAHNQTLDARNRCGASDPYSKTNSQTSLGDGEYCGIGCLGEACLYYQIGCYAGCGTCSLTGKDLYPTQADLDLANNCKPIEPTLGGGDPVHERELRTHNVDSSSSMGDWTKVNPWRAPGTAGMGNPNFQPCGINSGGAASFSNPETTAKDVPKAGPGTALPKIGHGPVWTRGTTVEVSWAIYANHAGGYSYRICKLSADGSAPTEECFQHTPLDFIGNQTEIRYTDPSKASVMIPAVTTSVGTYPKGSMWRKNPVPMCNCDLGYGCFGWDTVSAFKKVNAKAGSEGSSGMMTPYSETNFRPGQTSSICPTGVQFPTAVDDVLGATPYMPGGKMSGSQINYQMVDKVKVPTDIPKGQYILSWRWDCEETPQVWNSCADITVA